MCRARATIFAIRDLVHALQPLPFSARLPAIGCGAHRRCHTICPIAMGRTDSEIVITMAAGCDIFVVFAARH